MTSVHVVRRATKSKKPRYYVRLSRGSWADSERLRHLGVCRTKEDADTLATRARQLLAAGVEPTRELLDAKPTTSGKTLNDAIDEWLASRIDLSPRTIKTYTVIARRARAALGHRKVAAITVGDVAAFVRNLDVEPRAAPKYVAIIRNVLKFEGVDPNPALDDRVRLPRTTRREHRIPTSAELERIRLRMADDRAAALLLLEHTGLRVAEACQLEWRDRRPGRLSVRDSKTAAGRRFVDDLDYPAELVSLLERPAHARDADLILGGLTPNSVAAAFRYACARAKTTIYSPHDLRHLHASRLHEAGWSGARMAERLGHGSAKITLDTYSHTVPRD